MGAQESEESCPTAIAKKLEFKFAKGTGVWHVYLMRFLITFGLGFALVLAACPAAPGQTAADGNVAGTWHFAGSAQLAGNTNFDNVKKILTLAPSIEFRNLSLERFSSWLAKSLFQATNDQSAAALRPLLDDLLSAETMSALGGTSQGPLNFIVALRLNDPRAQAWQAALPTVIGAPGQSFKAQDFTGQQWKLAGGQSFWIVRAKEWLLAGAGDDLAGVQTQYLQQISQKGRPGPALNQSWLEADLDWPRLTHWWPDLPAILQPARTKVTFTAPNQSILMKAQVVYPQAIPWKFDPWRIPTNIIRDPLISFTAGQDVAAYMNPGEALSKLTDNPLTGQYYVWAMGEMVLQTYGAWPVADATNSLRRIAAEAPEAFNPALKDLGAGELRWQPERKTLLWGNLSSIMSPALQVAPETNGQYLLVSFFPLVQRNKPAPEDLLQQIRGRTNLVYYDWEGTGQRLMPWRMFSSMLPVVPRMAPPATPGALTNNSPAAQRVRSALVVEENWLSGLTPMLMTDNTITEITRTGPAELTVVRQSPFALTSVELVLLSHWFTGTGRPPVNLSLLPPPAKVTGPGVPPTRP